MLQCVSVFTHYRVVSHLILVMSDCEIEVSMRSVVNTGGLPRMFLEKTRRIVGLVDPVR